MSNELTKPQPDEEIWFEEELIPYLGVTQLAEAELIFNKANELGLDYENMSIEQAKRLGIDSNEWFGLQNAILKALEADPNELPKLLPLGFGVLFGGIESIEARQTDLGSYELFDSNNIDGGAFCVVITGRGLK